MRLIATLLLALIAGWGLGWYSHQQWGISGQGRLVIPDYALQEVKPRTHNVKPESDPGIEALLEQSRFDAAIEYYVELQLRSGQTAADADRSKILSHVRGSLLDRDYDSARLLLQLFIDTQYRDVEATALLSEVYYGQQRYDKAIEQLYIARGYAIHPDVINRLTNRIRSRVDEWSRQLKGEGSYNRMLELYLQLTRLEPEYAPYFIALADTQLALNDKEAAKDSLLLVSQDPDVGPKAQAMLADLDLIDIENRKQLADIPLVRKGDHFLVNVSTGGTSGLGLLIDTGASMTILDYRAIENLGLAYRDTGRVATFNTANGSVQAPVYRLESITVGDWQVREIEIGVLDLGLQTDVDGLLGMNFLRHFQFFIDQDKAVLRLSTQ